MRDNGWGFDDLEALLLDPRNGLEDVARVRRAELALEAETGEPSRRDTIPAPAFDDVS